MQESHSDNSSRAKDDEVKESREDYTVVAENTCCIIGLLETGFKK